ncbi:DNA polymerase III subunit alpha [Escherichia coli]|uniref:DNA polymerase III subunit alpha n=1 Tax=Escherichia coli TaxID=562 RepID=A0A376YFG0_ECOLX|nr:DNA polymerase III subunit alpha [Escherichia coli]
MLSGYTLGGADMLRRAMGKKKPEEMAKQRSVFAEGAEKNGINAELAMKIFDLVEKFAGYGFNKSHSAAYCFGVISNVMAESALSCGVYGGGNDRRYGQHREGGGSGG